MHSSSGLASERSKDRQEGAEESAAVDSTDRRTYSCLVCFSCHKWQRLATEGFTAEFRTGRLLDGVLAAHSRPSRSSTMLFSVRQQGVIGFPSRPLRTFQMPAAWSFFFQPDRIPSEARDVGSGLSGLHISPTRGCVLMLICLSDDIRAVARTSDPEILSIVQARPVILRLDADHQPRMCESMKRARVTRVKDVVVPAFGRCIQALDLRSSRRGKFGKFCSDVSEQSFR